MTLAYRHRFVDKIKTDGTKLSKLCITACKDIEHRLYTAASTMKRIPLRLMLAVPVTKRFSIHVKDATKAFITSKHPFVGRCT